MLLVNNLDQISLQKMKCRITFLQNRIIFKQKEVISLVLTLTHCIFMEVPNRKN